jgi:mRNA interferase RelE/StbE
VIAVLHRITLSPIAREMLAGILDSRVLEKIRSRIDGLSLEPEKQGKPMSGDLMGYRSLRAVGQRYRILYRVDRREIQVCVTVIGIRKEGDRQDIYAVAARLVRLGLL